MKFGICCHPDALETQTSSFDENLAALQNAGVDYLEFPVACLAPESDDAALNALREKLDGVPLQVEAFNGFLPAHQRITGDDVDLPAVLEYSRVALERAQQLGGAVVVLGSGKARRVPDGFDAVRAREQFIAYCRELAPIAKGNAVTICIEPLNAGEDNLICSVAAGAKIVDEVAHPSIQLLADFYHMMQENEPLENVTAAGARLRHTHLADTGRVVPGHAEDGEADFAGFFRALKDAGYVGSTPDATQAQGANTVRCSFEGSYGNMMEQAAPMMRLLRARWETA